MAGKPPKPPLKSKAVGKDLINLDEDIKQRKERKVYSDGEINSILEYLRDTIVNGDQIEKPNARSYYKKMIENMKLQNCDNVSVINKLTSLKCSYEKAIKWREHTGQGIEDEGTVKDYILKICPFFDLLDEIYGNRVTFHPPYNGETEDIGEEPGDIEVVEIPEVKILVTGSSSGKQETDRRLVSPPITPQNVNPAGKRQSDFIVATIKRTEVRLAETDVEKKRIKLESEKLTLEGRKLDIEEKKVTHEEDLEKQKQASEQRKWNLEERKMDLQFEMFEDDRKFKREKMQQDFELEKFRIQQENNLKLELAKLGK